MDALDLVFAGIARQAELIRRREVSSRELVEVCLDRIVQLEPSLNAFRCVLADEARAAADAADRRIAADETAPLRGVPVAVKDEVEVAGTVNAHGSRAFDRIANRDDASVQRLRDAGAIIIGKTQLPELGICGFTESRSFGVTRNPWALDRTPGGSSGGSAAAVAAGLIGAASASDGMGSIRIPAAFTGLFGLKPQRGRLPHAPFGGDWYGLIATGCLSRRVADTALWLDIASEVTTGTARSTARPTGTFSRIVAKAPGRLRIAWTTGCPRALLPAALDDDVCAVVEATATRLAGLGHEIIAREPAWGTIANDATIRYLAGIRADIEATPHPDRLERRTRGFGYLGRCIPRALVARTVAHEAARTRRLRALFDKIDVLLMPCTGTPAFEIGRWTDASALRTLLGMSRVFPYTGAWNVTGQPAASIPAGRSSTGLPIGVQLIAAPYREDILLRLAAQLEADIGWPSLRPPLADKRP